MKQQRQQQPHTHACTRMRPSPLETNGSHVEAVTRPLRLGEPSVGHPESTQPHPIRLRAEVRDLKLPQNVRACVVWHNKRKFIMYFSLIKQVLSLHVRSFLVEMIRDDGHHRLFIRGSIVTQNRPCRLVLIATVCGTLWRTTNEIEGLLH